MVGGNLHNTHKSQDEGAPANWCRVGPIPVTGKSHILLKQAPHPNAAKLFLEWSLSPQGLLAYTTITQQGIAAGSRQAKLLEGLSLVYRTEDVSLKAAELGVHERFLKALGITFK